MQLGQVGTTDGSLEQTGLVVLEDDKNWQNAENLVPVVNSAWLKNNPKAEDALNKLSDVLTTEDLTDAQRQGRRRAAGGEPGGRGLPQGEGARLGPEARWSAFEQVEQVGAVPALDQRLGPLAQLVVAEEALPPRDLLRAADLQPLPVLDRADVVPSPRLSESKVPVSSQAVPRGSTFDLQPALARGTPG